MTSDYIGSDTPADRDVESKVDNKEQGSLKELIKDKRHFRNLILLLFLWVASAFNYNLINF